MKSTKYQLLEGEHESLRKQYRLLRESHDKQRINLKKVEQILTIADIEDEAKIGLLEDIFFN